MTKRPKPPQGPRKTIFRPWITLRSGKRLYASAYGLRAWALKVRE